MRPHRNHAPGWVVWILLAGAAGAAHAQALTVCMAENHAPLSYRQQGQTVGLDVRVAQAIADDLKRPLKVIEFESKYEADSSLTHEVNALLSSGVCDLASGFPLLVNELGAPSRPTARVPDYPGAPRPPQRPWVPLNTLAASPAYHAVALGLVVRDAQRSEATLAQPGDARIGVTAGTMAGTAVTLYRNGKLRPQLVTIAQNQDALEELEAGRIDATLVSLDRYDAWRLRHPTSALRRAAYLHPLRINIGFVALASSIALLDASQRVVARALADGQLQRWTTDAGVSWVPPTDPQVGLAIGLPDLMQE